MSVSVEGEKCPVCHSYLFDDEDIVFCPVCGAAHHRECYNSINHCALEEYHGTDMQYKRPEVLKKPEKDDASDTLQNNNKENNPDPQSNNSNAQNPYGQYNPNNNQSQPNNMGGMPYGFSAPFAIDAFGGVDKNAVTDGVSANDLKNLVGLNSQRYIPKFFKLSKKSTISWNWAAFLFPQSWFFSRKIYNFGFLFFTLSVVFGVLTLSPMTVLADTSFSGYAQVQSAVFEIIQNYPSLYILMAAGAIFSVILRVVAGLFADYIYKCRAVKSVKFIKEQPADQQMLLNLKYGGVNIILAMITLFANSWIITLVYSLL